MQKDDQFWLNVGFVVTFLLVLYIGASAVEMLGVQMGWAERYDWFPLVQNAFGILVAGGTTFWAIRNQEKREYWLSSIAELRKVSWPTWPDVKRMTIIVCAVVAVFAVILGLFDVVWAKALSFII